jgi:hypothetical protein
VYKQRAWSFWNWGFGWRNFDQLLVGQSCGLLVGVPMGRDEEEDTVDSCHDGQEPIILVQARLVSIRLDPVLLTASACDLAQDDDNGATEEVGNPCVAQEQGCAYALHVIRRLVVEKFQHAHPPENLIRPQSQLSS